MITFEKIRKNHTYLQIAIALGYCTAEDTTKKKNASKSRISNWRINGIPPLAIKRSAAILAKLVKVRFRYVKD